MTKTVTTPEFRGCFLQVFRPGKPKTAPAEQAPNYSVRAAFPPDADFKAMKQLAEAAVRYKFPEGAPKNMRSPFRRNDELDNPIKGIPDDWIIVTFTRREQDGPPSVFGPSVEDIRPADQHKIYAGAWYQASVSAYAYAASGNKGVSFGLQGLQLRRDGDTLGGGVTVATATDFAPAEESASGGMFD